ncbi:MULTISPECIES: DUF1801 domain-containing protein [unclassified Lentilitoribacter]|jgi:hypothetical protein|uniref:DUF1801 domain-containing protein n=1 Tax=unclassified Lentilitoribacter TaxID=2647570 RepID=UPI0013A6C946|nr:DUF1801 domain-containing protein [Lentilitoribacter sp. Alg239-R112]
MADLKTKPHDGSVLDFLNAVDHKTRREDAFKVLEIFERVTCDPPVMWGPSIVGFGQYHYKYDSGREGDWLLAGFSPRKAHQVIYMMGCYHSGGFDGQQELFAKLGKHKMGASCLYINKLADIDIDVLEDIIDRSCQLMRTKYH